MATTRNDTEAHEGIRQILRSGTIATQAEDDMTLMICAWRAAGEADGSARPAA